MDEKKEKTEQFQQAVQTGWNEFLNREDVKAILNINLNEGE